MGGGELRQQALRSQVTINSLGSGFIAALGRSVLWGWSLTAVRDAALGGATIVIVAVAIGRTGGLPNPLTHVYYLPLLYLAFRVPPTGALLGALLAGLLIVIEVTTTGTTRSTWFIWPLMFLAVTTLASAWSATIRRQRQELVALVDESTALFRTLITLAPMGVYVAQDGKFKFVNPHGQKLAGYSQEDLLDKDCVVRVYPEDRQLARENAVRMLKGEMSSPYEYRYVTKEGEVRWVMETVAPVHYQGRQAVAGIFMDVTELKRGEEERRALSQRLLAANKELEAFAYSVAHDLRAPLRSMDGFSQALLEDYANQLDERGKDYLQRVRSGAQRMAELIDALLALSRVSRSELRREAVDLSTLVRSVATALQKRQRERQVEFVIADGLLAQGDPQLLRLALENLLDNAWKFTARRQRAHIEFGSLDQADGSPVYFVRDDGAGFDMAYADKLFGPFQRLHGAAEFEGIGIGLATVQRIIHRHGGRIWAEGAVDQGATFYFTLASEEPTWQTRSSF